MTAPGLSPVALVRRFNRFYTRRIGVLEKGHLQSPFSLAEVRLLYEIAHQDEPTATELARGLDLDAGYLSRLLGRLVRRGLVGRRIPGQDSRRRHLRLTRQGQKAFANLDSRATEQIASLLHPLPPPERERLVGAMAAIERLLQPASEAGQPFQLRGHRPGDLGWVVERHGALYFAEYGWDERFEGLVAGIVAEFVRDYHAARDRCWIAERDGQRVGCVFLVREPGAPGTARLRCLLVDPAARGHGLGQRLIGECIRFARQAGYQRIVLWTNDVLAAARRLYQREGFVLIRSEPHQRFGHGLVGETWELTLTA